MMFTTMQIVTVHLIIAHTHLVNGWPLPQTVNLTPLELPFNDFRSSSTEMSSFDESSYEITESTIEPLQTVTENQPDIIAPLRFSFPFFLSNLKAKVLQSLGFPFIPQFFKNWFLPLPLPMPVPQLKPLLAPTLQPITSPSTQNPTLHPLFEMPGVQTPMNASAPPGQLEPIPVL